MSPAKGLTKTGRMAAAALVSPHRRVAGKEMHERELEERKKKKERVKWAAAACGARSRGLAGSAEAAEQAGGAVAQTLLAGGCGQRARRPRTGRGRGAGWRRRAPGWGWAGGAGASW